MRVTRLGPTKPLLTLTGILSASESGPSGQVPTSNGSNEVAWGSNVANIWVNGTTKVLGPEVNIANGSNTTVTVDMVGALASNTIRIHATGGAGSFGSNATRVSENSTVGASANSAREDHIHDGIGTITASSSNTMQRGTWNLRPGAGIALSLTDTDGDGEFDTTTIVNTGQGGGGGTSTADAVRNQVGNGEIILPELAISPLIIPGGSADMEFNSTTIGGTALGSPTTIDANTTYKSCLYVKKAAATGFSLQGRYWTLSGLSLTLPVTMTVHIPVATICRDNFMRVGMGFAEATPGKTEGIYFDQNSGRYISTISSTSPTAGAAYVQQGTATTWQLQPPIWFRVKMTSSTDVTWSVSTDGKSFTTFGTASRNPGFTIGSVFVAVDPENATYDVEAAYGSIRFT